MGKVIALLVVVGAIFALAWAMFGRDSSITRTGSELTAANGGIRIAFTSDPAGASLTADGHYMGKTPVAIYAATGQPLTYRVEVEEMGVDYKLYKPYTGSLTPTAPATISVWIDRTTAAEQAAQRQQAENVRRAAQQAACRNRFEGAVVIIEDWHWGRTRGGGYAEAEGRVTNNTTSTLNSIQAMVEYETATGQFITSDYATIELRDLLPGQSSPFSVLTDYNPAMARASLRFREFFGSLIPSVARASAGC